MNTNWSELAWDEFKILQGIIDRQMSVRWHIRGSLLALQAALTAAVFTEKLPINSFFWGCVAATIFAWLLEMVENFVISKAVYRQTEIEAALSKGCTTEAPAGFRVPMICESLRVTSHGWDTIKYVISCLVKLRRLLVLAIFLGLPCIVKFVLF